MRELPVTPPADIDRRLPVWVALSELFLDTQLQPTDYRTIAAMLWDSGYTAEELRTIFDLEVTPAFAANLFSVAGEWTSWPEDAVRDIMISSLASTRKHAPINWLKRRWLRRHLDAEWDRVARLLMAA